MNRPSGSGSGTTHNSTQLQPSQSPTKYEFQTQPKCINPNPNPKRKPYRNVKHKVTGNIVWLYCSLTEFWICKSGNLNDNKGYLLILTCFIIVSNTVAKVLILFPPLTVSVRLWHLSSSRIGGYCGPIDYGLGRMVRTHYCLF